MIALMQQQQQTKKKKQQQFNNYRLCAPMIIKAAPNIALIKYWGKSDENLNIPLNTSISITLDRNDLYTEMLVNCNGREKTVMKINGEDVNPIPDRVQRMMKACAEYDNAGLEIISSNSFPMSCGLASSSSGMAALAFGIAWFSGCGEVDKNDEEQVSLLARLGSGSACRSIYGGFVEWPCCEPYLPRQLQPHTHWPELEIIILIFDSSVKLVGSSEGMKLSTQTSRVLRQRIAELNSNQSSIVDALKKAIEEKEFNKFAEITMRESNYLHSVCMDTYPPLLYLSDASHALINFVHLTNNWSEKENESLKLAYSFDAGPNAFCFTDKPDVVLDLLKLIYNFAAVQKLPVTRKIELLVEKRCTENGAGIHFEEIEENSLTKHMNNATMRLMSNFVNRFVKQLKDVIITRPGPAPLISLGDTSTQ